MVVVDRMKNILNRMKKLLFLTASFIFSVFILSACSINIDPSNLVPELFINTDASLEYITSDEIYRIELLVGDEYEIDAELGEYDGEEYFIEYSLESEESVLILDENKITVSASAEVGVVEKVFVKLKKVGEEKTYQTEIIEVVIVLEKS